jgi:hypothetical protein
MRLRRKFQSLSALSVEKWGQITIQEDSVTGAEQYTNEIVL